MTNYQHILIAADFSSHNQQVIEKAQQLAQLHNAKLSICRIIEDYPITDFAYEPMISVDLDLRDSMLSAAKKQIETLATPLNIPNTQQWVEFGTPKLDIVNLADEHHVDLIIIGSHGRHGLQLLLGSTANAVLHHAHCDVLAVRLKDS
jgi:universal stress protein A